MISPALMTFSFYRDLAEKQTRVDCLLRRLPDLCLQNCPKNALNLSQEVGAFILIFPGSPPETPICNIGQLQVSKMLLKEKLIDAYEAGVSSEGGRCERYFEGNLLAVAVALSSMLAVRIPQEELEGVLSLISDANVGACTIEQISGSQHELRQSIAKKCYEVDYRFSFLKKIKGWKIW